MGKARPKVEGGMPDHAGVLMGGVAVVVFLLWISFTASVKLHELLLGSLATAFTVALFINMLRREQLQFSLHLQDLLLVRLVPAAILKDAWILLVVLFKDLIGREPAGSYYRACGFRVSMHNRLRVGRSALAVAYTTTSPNMIVIGIDTAQSLMLFHQLKRDSVPDFAQKLGAAGQHPVAGAQPSTDAGAAQ